MCNGAPFREVNFIPNRPITARIDELWNNRGGGESMGNRNNPISNNSSPGNLRIRLAGVVEENDSSVVRTSIRRVCVPRNVDRPGRRRRRNREDVVKDEEVARRRVNSAVFAR